MSIKCPYCAFVLELKGVRAGHFHPTCPHCKSKFGLVVHSDEKMQPTVTALSDHINAGIADALGIKEAKARPNAPKAPHVTQAPVSTKSESTKAVSTHASETHAPTHAPAPSPKAAATVLSATSVPPSAATQAPTHAMAKPLMSAPPASPPATPHVSIPPTDAHVVEGLHTGTNLGGYEIMQKLGQGGMGYVFLARQVSLDRNIALKILNPRLAEDAQLVSRFTREAYAAAQLTHHNIVQIHDIGQDKGFNFFSMEFVQGQTLAHVLSENGKVDVETAVTYILQAARGLKFAHEHGLIHRDIKPENLLLNDQGIVKVADLGLVKKIGSQETARENIENAEQAGVAITQYNKSMGTPLYMPPEQAQDAARVDLRADIYSLGCTLYHLITGRPPFVGRTAMEVMTKHQNEPVTPPDVVVKDVPHALSPIVVKMLSKNPDQRYQSMKEVITALEDFLGIATSGPFVPKDEHVKILEFAASRYNESLWARLRSKLVMSFYALCVLLAGVLWWMNDGNWLGWGLAGGMIGIGVLTTLSYQLTIGLSRKTALFQKTRQLVLGAGFFDWIKWIAVFAIVAYLLYAFDLHWWWIGAAALSFGIAQAYYFTIDAMAAKDRETSLVQAESLIKKMRLRGLDEMAIRQFVCKFAGKHWEEIFENLFGYEEKLQARKLWGKERGRERPKFGAWRDKVIAYIEHRIAARKEAREARLLAKVEERLLASKGLSTELARKQARKNADRLVDRAHLMKRESERHVARTALAPSAKETMAPSAKETAAPTSGKKDKDTLAQDRMQALAKAISSEIGAEDTEGQGDPNYVRQSYVRRRYGSPVDIVLAPMWRVVVGMLLLACFAMWWNQNKRTDTILNNFDPSKISATDATQLIKKGKDIVAKEVINANATADLQSQPLRVPMVPDRITDLLSGYPALIAGLLMVIGGLYRGNLLSVGMYASGAVALLGHHLTTVPFHDTAAIVYGAAAAVWVFSVIFLSVSREL